MEKLTALQDLGICGVGKKIFLYYNLSINLDNSFRTAVSSDGLKFRSFSKNPEIVDEAGNKKNTRFLGNFRVSKLKGKYFLIYNDQDYKISGASSGDAISWKDSGDLGIEGTGMVIPSYKYKNQYVMYFGKEEIKAAFSKNLKNWKVEETVLSPRSGIFDSFPVKVLSVFLTDEGILLFYNSQSLKREGSQYLVGAALFDKNDPKKLIWRSDDALWEPKNEFLDKKLFSLGAVIIKDDLLLYFVVEQKSVVAIHFREFVKDFVKRAGAKNPNLSKVIKNPIIEPVLEHFWESQATFNPAALNEDGKIHLVYRAIGDNNISVLGYASSSDGLNFDERSDDPIYVPTQPFEFSFGGSPTVNYMSGGGYGGCEDPRLTKIGDRIYMTYVAFNGFDPPRIALTSIKASDFMDKKWNWEKPKIISKPGVVDKNACIFPEKIKGKFVIMHRIFPDILIDYLDNLNFEENQYLKGEFKIEPRLNSWDSRKVGAGPPPIKTKKGWLLIYHAVDERDSSKYKMGAMILDLEDPTKVLYRSNRPILEPTEKYENEGYKSGVAYPCGAVEFEDNLIVYYGGADKVVCAAKQNMDLFLQLLISSGSPKLEPEIRSKTILMHA